MIELPKYPKIYGPFKRGLDHKLMTDVWSRDEFEYLANNQWEFREKIDGTNIRIGLNAEEEYFVGGRTDKAQIPKPLATAIEELGLEKKLKEMFDKPVTLFGEGYGVKIQAAGASYLPKSNGFILFDVLIGNIWLDTQAILSIAAALEIPHVPIIGKGTLAEGIALVTHGFQSKITELECPAEGIVAVPTCNLVSRSGGRIIVKLKSKDFQNK